MYSTEKQKRIESADTLNFDEFLEQWNKF